MRRYKHCRTIPMAEGAVEPTWPLPGVRPRFATWSLCGGRPFACGEDCKRWHAGIDLVGAEEGALVVAPEAGTLVRLDTGWSAGARAVFMRTDTGLFVVLGGTIAGSGAEWDRKAGDRVAAGDAIGRVKGSYGMIHLETYADDGKRTHNSRWYVGDPPPVELRNPLNYVQRAAGLPATLDSHAQRQQALIDLGYRPDAVGEFWGDRSTADLKQAQAALGLDADGVWGPKTEEAIRRALDEQIEREAGPCLPDEDGPCPPAIGGDRDHDDSDDDNSGSGPSRPPTTTPGRPRPATIVLGAVGVAAVLGGVLLFARSMRARPARVEERHR